MVWAEGNALQRQMEEQKLPEWGRVGSPSGERLHHRDTRWLRLKKLLRASVSLLRQSPHKLIVPHLQEAENRMEKIIAINIYCASPKCRALC